MKPQPTLSIYELIRAVAETAGLSPQDFILRQRTRRVSYARHLVIYCMRYHFPQLSLQQIGQLFHRHHSAIINSLGSHQRLIAHDPNYQTLYLRLQQHLAQAPCPTP